MNEAIIQTVLNHYPDIQAIYLFGSYGTDDEWPDSDADIALLFSPDHAPHENALTMLPLQGQLEELLARKVDLINLRRVDTVFKKEIVMADRRVFCAEQNAADEFEMLTISYYGKLNEERAEILEEGIRSGRFYAV